MKASNSVHRKCVCELLSLTQRKPLRRHRIASPRSDDGLLRVKRAAWLCGGPIALSVHAASPRLDARGWSLTCDTMRRLDNSSRVTAESDKVDDEPL